MLNIGRVSRGKFYGSTKLYKVQTKETVLDELHFRPIISNIGTAIYDLVRHLAQPLNRLSDS